MDGLIDAFATVRHDPRNAGIDMCASIPQGDATNLGFLYAEQGQVSKAMDFYEGDGDIALVRTTRSLCWWLVSSLDLVDYMPCRPGATACH